MRVQRLEPLILRHRGQQAARPRVRRVDHTRRAHIAPVGADDEASIAALETLHTKRDQNPPRKHGNMPL